ncbi:hypothetical protein [Calothrix sp. UHCC 0171]|uniref:hypothetical protein n=1 Tax=Calothrix sp. UHCC 0171 TaxID=3110245 RepID=UPI002B1F39DA|nr:hypothetical protein [Calothrix sp. UHCC 0171]MEA5574065.1 hypothetical protein [Calothrix sp. UHCC 0171]
MQFPVYDCAVVVYRNEDSFKLKKHDKRYFAAFGRIPCIGERVAYSALNVDSVSGLVVDVMHYQFTDINLNTDTSLKAEISIITSDT